LYEYIYPMGVVPNISGCAQGRLAFRRIAQAFDYAAHGRTAYRCAGVGSWPGVVHAFANGLLATETALALRVHAEAMESTANTLARTASNFSHNSASIRGVVRVSASDVIGVEVLPPLIARLRESHPQITIELVLSNRVQDLLHREADIAVRMTTPVQEQLIARRVGRIELGLHASTSYLARHGTPENSQELLKHALVGFDQNTPFIRKVLEKYPQLSRIHFPCAPIATWLSLILFAPVPALAYARCSWPMAIFHCRGYCRISFLYILIPGSSCTKTCAIVCAANWFSIFWQRD
jgi:hypothetical protein